jgi:hypothetical protein
MKISNELIWCIVEGLKAMMKVAEKGAEHAKTFFAGFNTENRSALFNLST